MTTAADSAKRQVVSVDTTDPELSGFAHESENKKAELEAKLVEIEGRRKFHELRETWSCWIIFWISVFILFHAAITFGVGSAKLDFNEHKWLVPLIVVENFLQIIGMGYIVVRFLYAGEPGAPAKAAGKSPNARSPAPRRVANTNPPNLPGAPEAPAEGARASEVGREG